MMTFKKWQKIFYLLVTIFGGRTVLAVSSIPSSGSPTLDKLVGKIIGTLNILIYVLFALATVAFAWGIIEMLAGAGELEKIESGRRHMIWGIIGLAIMFSAWGLVKMISNYLFGNGW